MSLKLLQEGIILNWQNCNSICMRWLTINLLQCIKFFFHNGYFWVWNSRIGCFHWKSIYTYIVMNPTFLVINKNNIITLGKQRSHIVRKKKNFPVFWNRLKNSQHWVHQMMPDINFNLSFSSVFFSLVYKVIAQFKFMYTYMQRIHKYIYM